MLAKININKYSKLHLHSVIKHAPYIHLNVYRKWHVTELQLLRSKAKNDSTPFEMCNFISENCSVGKQKLDRGVVGSMDQ